MENLKNDKSIKSVGILDVEDCSPHSDSKCGLIFGSFVVAEMEVAINVSLVQEVVNFPDSVTAMPLPTNYLEGIFNLRGVIIPIVNLKSILSLGESTVRGDEKIAVVDCAGAKIGLIFDSTSEVLRIKETDIIKPYRELSQNSFMDGCIKVSECSRVLNILNINSLLKISNISDIILKQKMSSQLLTHQNFQKNMKKCISFSVGDLSLGFEITGINEVVKVEDLKVGHLTSELCLGIIELRGLVIPVIDINFFLEGSGYVKKNIVDQRIVILKGESTCVGLLVDSVKSIQNYSEHDVMVIPVFKDKYQRLFLGCISNEIENDVVLMDHKVILANSKISEVSKGHDLIYNKDFKDERLERKKVVNQSYITFLLGGMYGFEIGEIREVINFSEDIASSPGSSPLIKGLLSLRGDTVIVVETRKLFNMDIIEPDYEKSKILIFEANSKLIGLIVDSLENIVTVDINTKRNLPSIVTRELEDNLGKDLKEVITYAVNGETDNVLIVLNADNIIKKF